MKSGFRGLVPFDDGADAPYNLVHVVADHDYAVDLPAHFFVWLASAEAHFLNGKFVWVNWDVGELKSRAEEIQNSPILTPNIVGWPFGCT